MPSGAEQVAKSHVARRKIAAEKAQESSGESDGSDDEEEGYIKRLGRKIADNLQVTIKNVHIRLEYLGPPSGRPIAFGISLEALRLCGCDAAGHEVYIDDSKDTKKQKQLEKLGMQGAVQTHRLLRMEALTVYVATPAEQHQLSRERADGSILGADAMPTLSAETPKCILEPISMVVLVAIGEPPHCPKTVATVELPSVDVRLHRTQYEDLVAVGNRLSAATEKGAEFPLSFLNYRPVLPASKAPRQWWKYARRCVVDKKQYMELHKLREALAREMDEFGRLSHVNDRCLTPDEVLELDMLELRIPAPQLMFFSNLVDAELTAEEDKSRLAKGKSKKEKKKRKKGKKDKKRFSKHFGKHAGGQAAAGSDDSDDGGDQVSLELTDDERAELYAAVSDRSAVQVEQITDPDYVATDLRIALKQVTFSVGTDHDLVVATVQADLSLRMFPATGTKNVAAVLQTVLVCDCSCTEPLYQEIVKSQSLPGKQTAFCCVDATLCEKETQLVIDMPSPAQIVCNVDTMKAALGIFAGVQVDPKIKEVKAKRVAKARRRAKQRVANARTSTKNLVLDANLRAPVFIIPHDCNSAKSEVLLLDLGNLVLCGRRFPNSVPESNSMIRDQMADVREFNTETAFTEHFRVSLSQLQVLVLTAGERDVVEVLQSDQQDPRRLLKRIDVELLIDIGNVPSKRMLVDVRTSHIEALLSPAQIETLLAFKTMLKSKSNKDKAQKKAKAKKSRKAPPAAQLPAAGAESSKAFFVMCPEVRCTLLNDERSVMWTAALVGMRAGAAVAGKEMKSVALLSDAQVMSVCKDGEHVPVLKTNGVDEQDFIRLGVLKEARMMPQVTTTVGVVVDDIAIGFYPVAISHVHQTISAISKPAVTMDAKVPTVPAAHTAAGAAAPIVSEAAGEIKKAAKILHVRLDLSKLTVQTAAVDANKVIYEFEIEKCTATIDRGQPECGLVVNSALGRVVLKDLTEETLWPEIIHLASGSIALSKYDAKVTKQGWSQPIDSEMVISLGEIVAAISPKSIKGLKLYLQEGVVGAVTNRAHKKVKPWAANFFAEADTDGDAVVSRAEFEAWFVSKNGRPPAAKDWAEFTAIDTDGSGDVSEHEFNALLESKKKNKAIKINTAASTVVIYPHRTSSTHVEARLPSSAVTKEGKALAVLIRADDDDADSVPRIFAQVISNLGGLTLPMLKLDVGVEIFQFNKLADGLHIHSLLSISAQFLDPTTQPQASWQDVVDCPNIFLAVKKTTAEKTVSIHPSDSTPLILGVSDSLFYSLTQARNAVKRKAVEKSCQSRFVNHSDTAAQIGLVGLEDEPDVVVQPGGEAHLHGLNDEHDENISLQVGPVGYEMQTLRLYCVGDTAVSFAKQADSPGPDRLFHFAVRLIDGAVLVTCNGGAKIANQTSKAFQVMNVDGTRATVGAKSSTNVPTIDIGINKACQIRLGPAGGNAVEADFVAVDIISEDEAAIVKLHNGTEVALQMKTDCNGEALLTITAPTVFQNLLPHDASFVITYNGQVSAFEAQAGGAVELFEISIAEGDEYQIVVTMDPGSPWSPGTEIISNSEEEHTVCVADRHGTKLFLTLKSTTPRSISIYAKHWLRNSTGLPLMLRSSKAKIWPPALEISRRDHSQINLLELGGNDEDPATKLYISVVGSEEKKMSTKKVKYASHRLQLRSVVHGQLYDLQVTIEAAPPPFQLSQVVTIQPHFALVNLLPVGNDIAFRTNASAAGWMIVPAKGQAVHYFPRMETPCHHEGDTQVQIALHEYAAGEYRCAEAMCVTPNVDSEDAIGATGPRLSEIKSGAKHDDTELPGGTRVLVAGFGYGTTTGIEKNFVGANDHKIRFDRSSGAEHTVQLNETSWHTISELAADDETLSLAENLRRVDTGAVVDVLEICHGENLRVRGRVHDGWVTLRTQDGRCMLAPTTEAGLKPWSAANELAMGTFRDQHFEADLGSISSQCSVRAGMQAAEWCFVVEAGSSSGGDSSGASAGTASNSAAKLSKPPLQLTVELPDIAVQISDMASARERYIRCPPTEPISHTDELNGLLFELAIDHLGVEVVKGDELELGVNIGGLRLIDSKDVSGERSYHSRVQGYLQKLGGFRHNWTTRYFVYDPEVSPTVVEYFEDKAKREKKGDIDLTTVSEARASTAPTAVANEIEVLTPERTWRLIAKDAVERGEWLRVFGATEKRDSFNHSLKERGNSTLMIDSRDTAKGHSFLQLALKKSPKPTDGEKAGAKSSLQHLEILANGYLGISVTDLQLLRLLAVIGNIKRVLKKPGVLRPDAVLATMRAPLDPNTGDFRYPLFIKLLAMPELALLLEFRRVSDLAPKKFKVPAGVSVEGLKLRLPSVSFEDTHGRGATVKSRLISEYKAWFLGHPGKVLALLPGLVASAHLWH
eukprot:SAG22_NODE_78_length_22065_cov_7.473095_15_plen_2392_part_00